jgi:hypothetical protein
MRVQKLHKLLAEEKTMPLILSMCFQNKTHAWDYNPFPPYCHQSYIDYSYGPAGSVVESKRGLLKGLYQGTGDWSTLKGREWLVIDVQEEDILKNDKGVCEFKKGKVLYHGEDTWPGSRTKRMNEEGLHEYAAVMALGSYSALQWAKLIGDREIMRDRVTYSRTAFFWAEEFGDKEVMIERINDEVTAYLWARKWPGDSDKLRKFITTSEYAFYWARDVGDVHVMHSLINDPSWALSWARESSLGYLRKMFNIVCRSDHYYNLWCAHKLPIFRDPQCWEDHKEQECQSRQFWRKFLLSMNENERRIYYEQCDLDYRRDGK